ncbi:AI-2E family transporter [Microlunatus soli]|uniref:Predicted PurR-regulated permease PerM n=1 Tax=Microlunatus soli TaxID=630515 RepID=A0A1H1YXY7_9ACTN|nr:AI-2E family transporter [Microlunatus soli]SDT26268.1 Predicted PurR-regulated permease PerM [Microlunatus soli]
MSETPSNGRTAGRPAKRLLPRGLMVLLGVAAVVIIVAGLQGAADILGATFLTLVLTIAVHPLHTLLARTVPSWLATIVCLIVVYLGLVALAMTLVVSAARFGSLLPDYEQRFDEIIGGLTDRLAALGIAEKQLHALTSGLDLSKLSSVVTAALSGVLGVASNLVFIITLLLFMTIDGSTFPRYLRAAGKIRPTIVTALIDFSRSTRRYLLVSTVFGLVVAVLDTTALAILGVPEPILWGLLALLTNYIPNIGFLIGLLPPAVLALLDGGVGLMLIVIVVYCVINLIIQSAIQPKVVGDTVGLSTTLTFMSLVFWSWVIGPLGAVLAIPLSLLVRAVLVDADPRSRWLGPLVANRELRTRDTKAKERTPPSHSVEAT